MNPRYQWGCFVYAVVFLLAALVLSLLWQGWHKLFG